MPISTAPYKRGYKHVKGRGRESLVQCDACGRKVPRYKTFVIHRRMTLGLGMDRRMVHMRTRTLRLCPACARFRRISKPGKSKRKKSTRIGIRR